MWSKQQTLAEAPAPSPAASPASNLTSSTAPTSATRSTISAPRTSARLGSSVHVKGEISGAEDLQIDGIVEGPIFLQGHELIVGATAQLKSEIQAGGVVVRGKVVGNVNSRGRVEITKDSSVAGDIACARISIDDGAHFKGRIEIDPAKFRAAAD